MKLVQTSFDVVELSPEAKSFKITVREMFGLYLFWSSLQKKVPVQPDLFARELSAAVEKAYRSYTPVLYQCFKLSGTSTGVAIRMNQRWFVKRFAR